MTATIYHKLLLLLTFGLLTVLSTSCANQGTETQQAEPTAKYPDETDEKAKKFKGFPSSDNYHAFLDSY